MTPLGALALLAVLLGPGGVNGLLRRTAARHGLWRTLPLVGAAWLAYCLAIGTWCTALGVLLLAAPSARPVVQMAAAGYVLWHLLARHRTAPLPGAWSLFPVALVDPVPLWCAALVFPALGAPALAVLQAYGGFTVIMVVAGIVWVAAGAGMRARHVALRRPVRRATAALLMAAGVARLR